MESFREQLVLTPLRDGRVVSHFTFETALGKGSLPRNPNILGSSDFSQHYRLFPISLGQLLREYSVTELHLTLNAGKWNYDNWGYPPDEAVGAGAELWAWMGTNDSEGAINSRFQSLRNALSGLFCASIGSLDASHMTSPALSFLPQGQLPALEDTRYEMRYASLPSEHVCTENLTPFLKNIPCKGALGLSSLLNPHKLFDADWHGMGVHVTWDQDEGVVIRLSFQAVFDPIRAQMGNPRKDWSLESLFERNIQNLCPVATSSRILVSLPVNEPYAISPEPQAIEDNMALYNLHNGTVPFDLSIKYPREFIYPMHPPPLVPLSIRRSLRGTTQDLGQISVILTNHNPTHPSQVRYLETMPWFVTFYLHTLETTVDGTHRDDIVSDLTYTPPILHKDASLLQTTLTLPPNSTTILTMDLLKGFLRYTEHRPDAQRGWDLPPAIFTPLNYTSHSDSTGVNIHRTYTPPLLVDLSTPDFSMPYNVIIFTCSLVAFLFGSVFNQLTRKFVVVSLEKEKRE